MSSAVSWINATYGVVGPTGPTGPAGPAGPSGPTGPASPARVMQFYKNAAQAAATGTTIITFDVASSFNDSGFISWTPGGSQFTIQQRGLYQIDLTVLNQVGTGVWTNLTKSLVANVTRSPFAASAALNDNVSISNGVTYSQSLVGTLELLVGDIVTMSLGQSLTSGSTSIAAAGNLPDLNTSITFTFLRATS